MKDMRLFEKDGFTILRNIFSEDELFPLREEANRLAKEAGSACVRNIRAKSSLFDSLALALKSKDFLTPEMIPVRSILFDKTDAENWPVPWHQDLTIAVSNRIEADGFTPWSIKEGIHHVQPPVSLLEKMITVRIHLDPTPAENGALRVIPGSHRSGRLNTGQVKFHKERHAETCSCDPGDVLLMAPLVLHASSRSINPCQRRILHFEFAPTDALPAGLNWHETQS